MATKKKAKVLDAVFNKVTGGYEVQLKGPGGRKAAKAKGKTPEKAYRAASYRLAAKTLNGLLETQAGRAAVKKMKDPKTRAAAMAKVKHPAAKAAVFASPWLIDQALKRIKKASK